jgi:hypothetical protein
MKGNRGKLHIRLERVQSHIHHGVVDPGGNFGDHGHFRVNPRSAGKFQRIFSSAQRQRRRRPRAPNMPEGNFGQPVAIYHFLSECAELETVGVERMEHEKQRGKAVAHQHGTIFLVWLGFMCRQPRLRQVQLAARVAEHHQIVVGGFFLEIDLVFTVPEFFLDHFFRAPHVGESVEILRHLLTHALQQVRQFLGGGTRRVASQAEASARQGNECQAHEPLRDLALSDHWRALFFESNR